MIAEMLKSDSTMLKINLGVNEIYLALNLIGDDGARVIAEMLRVNSTLQVILL
jgi:hypothetical protein